MTADTIFPHLSIDLAGPMPSEFLNTHRSGSLTNQRTPQLEARFDSCLMSFGNRGQGRFPCRIAD